MPTKDQIRQNLADLIATASEGSVTAAQVIGSQDRITALGLPSVVQLRAIDAVENAYGVTLDLDREDISYLDSLDGLLGYLAEEGVDIDG